jgi:hypothetical protein
MSRLAPSSSFPIASSQISSCSNEARKRTASAKALGMKEFATFDTRQRALAEAVGLTSVVAD